MELSFFMLTLQPTMTLSSSFLRGYSYLDFLSSFCYGYEDEAAVVHISPMVR